MRIRTKILLPMMILVILVAAAILISNAVLFTNFVDKSLADSVNASALVAKNNLDVLKTQAQNASLYIAENDVVVTALENNDHDILLEQAIKLQNETGLEFCTITDSAGMVIVRSHEPENYGDSVTSQDNIQSAMNGKNLTAIEEGAAVRLSVRSGSPVLDEQGKVIGVVSGGFRLDTEQFVDSVKALTGSETTIFLGDERIATTVLKEDGTRAVGTKADATISEMVLSGSSYIGKALILDIAAVANYSPVFDSAGQVIGMLFVGHYADETEKIIWSFVQSGVLIIAVLLVISILAILFIVKRIVAPIKLMIDAATSLAAGDTDIDVKVNTRDEIRDLTDAFNHMAENTRRQIEIIQYISEGDLSVSVASRSEKDSMNNALASMLEQNNRVFSNISASANRVSMGANQVAGGAQALAAGTTQQAASVEELSSTVSEINSMTKRNTQNATVALNDVQQSGRLMDVCMEQMRQMLAAMRTIDERAQDISKTAKAINDIASQTNILALNASVEAARAGQHGRGFAVVAEEVRMLASQSAEAARETSALIDSSSQSVAEGNLIVGKVGESLQALAKIAQKNAVKIADLQSVSLRQSEAMEQVNIGIDQIAQVVQKNSATAEESAAASEEMSGQSTILQEMISQFKLRDGSAVSISSLQTGNPRHLAKLGQGIASLDSYKEREKYRRRFVRG